MSDEDVLYDEEENTDENQYLLSKLDREEYGINIVDVQSIEELQSIVAVPDMPSYVKGVINLRGQVIPVIDMRLKLKMSEKDYDDRTCIVIVKIDEANVGLIVDTVSEVINIPENSIDPAPSFKETEHANKYISGIGKIGDEVKILLDVSKLLQDRELQEIKTQGESYAKQ